jgi:hypothetical protein
MNRMDRMKTPNEPSASIRSVILIHPVNLVNPVEKIRCVLGGLGLKIVFGRRGTKAERGLKIEDGRWRDDEGI